MLPRGAHLFIITIIIIIIIIIMTIIIIIIVIIIIMIIMTFGGGEVKIYCKEKTTYFMAASFIATEMIKLKQRNPKFLQCKFVVNLLIPSSHLWNSALTLFLCYCLSEIIFLESKKAYPAEHTTLTG